MKTRNSKTTRKITMLLSAIMLSEQLASTGAVLYAHAEDVTPAEYTIVHNVTSSWDGGCSAEIILTNQAEVDTENWSVTFCTRDEITNLWGGKIMECEELLVSDASVEMDDVTDAEEVSEMVEETESDETEIDEVETEEAVAEETTEEESTEKTEEVEEAEEETDTAEEVEEVSEDEEDAVEEETEEALEEELLEEELLEEETEEEVEEESEEEDNLYYRYTVEALDYNAVIPAGGSITIGYNVNGEDHEIWDAQAEIVLKEVEVEEERNPEGNIYEGDGYTVEVVIPAYWDGAYNVQLRITNTSEETLHNWAFVMATKDSISNLYNAVELSDKDGVRLIKNAGYNQDIPAGGTVEVGYTANYDGDFDVPVDFALSQIEKEVTTAECEVSLFVTEEWENGGLAEIILTNISELPIEDWMLEFDSTLEIEEMWGGVIENHEGEHYFIRNAEYAQNIVPGESWTIGMLFSGDAADIRNVEVRQIAVDEGETPKLVKIIDDSLIVELDTSMADREVGRLFYKEIASDDDITVSSKGLLCVRDQILITVIGKNYDEVSSVVESFDARIVGCIELTGDYQIEFNQAKNIEEVEKIVSDLQNESYIKLVDLNYIWLEEPSFSTSDPWIDGMFGNGTAMDWDASALAYGSNWGIEAINLAEGLGEAGVLADINGTGNDINLDKLSETCIGIIDVAFDEGHEDLEIDRNFMSYQSKEYERLLDDFKDSENMCHGTQIAGIIGATFNNGIGISGVSLKHKLYVAALGEDGQYWKEAIQNDKESSAYNKHVFKVKCALDTLVISGAKVINCYYSQ